MFRSRAVGASVPAFCEKIKEETTKKQRNDRQIERVILETAEIVNRSRRKTRQLLVLSVITGCFQKRNLSNRESLRNQHIFQSIHLFEGSVNRKNGKSVFGPRLLQSRFWSVGVSPACGCMDVSFAYFHHFTKREISCHWRARRPRSKRLPPVLMVWRLCDILV